MKQILLCLLLLASYSLHAQETYTGQVSKELLLGKIQYQDDTRFVHVDLLHATRAMYLDKKVYSAFVNMYNAAKKDGIELKIVSAARNFEYQKAIWERKWKRNLEMDPLCRTEKILEFSSMPATSRHHWGTDIDLNNLENSYFEKGPGKAVYQWLTQNASRFGFYQVYTSKETGRKGYSEEKWHWSYMPLASQYLDAYNSLVSYEDIQGFEGSEFAKVKQMITHYVNGIAPFDPEPIQPARPSESEIAAAGTAPKFE